jgi:hypothetical protein
MIRFEDGIALASMEAAMLSFRILEGKDITMMVRSCSLTVGMIQTEPVRYVSVFGPR